MSNKFCCYYLQAFRTEEILKRHIKYCFKIKKGEYISHKMFWWRRFR